MVTYLFDNKKSVSFDIEVGAQNKFYLSNFIVAGEETGERFEGIIGDSIQTSAGTLAISLTSQYENFLQAALFNIVKNRLIWWQTAIRKNCGLN